MLELKFHCLIAVLDYWRFTSFVFRYDFAKAKSARHQLVHRDVSRRLRRRRTCQNPLSWILAARPAQRSSRQDEFRYAHSCQNPLSWIIGGSQALYSVTILQKQNLHVISLFTGTCLGGFAAVALAKIRKKKLCKNLHSC